VFSWYGSTLFNFGRAFHRVIRGKGAKKISLEVESVSCYLIWTLHMTVVGGATFVWFFGEILSLSSVLSYRLSSENTSWP
jgi:hypothetical protein